VVRICVSKLLCRGGFSPLAKEGIGTKIGTASPPTLFENWNLPGGDNFGRRNRISPQVKTKCCCCRGIRRKAEGSRGVEGRKGAEVREYGRNWLEIELKTPRIDIVALLLSVKIINPYPFIDASKTRPSTVVSSSTHPFPSIWYPPSCIIFTTPRVTRYHHVTTWKPIVSIRKPKPYTACAKC
jgi:hypothetical protein